MLVFLDSWFVVCWLFTVVWFACVCFAVWFVLVFLIIGVACCFVVNSVDYVTSLLVVFICLFTILFLCLLIIVFVVCLLCLLRLFGFALWFVGVICSVLFAVVLWCWGCFDVLPITCCLFTVCLLLSLVCFGWLFVLFMFIAVDWGECCLLLCWFVLCLIVAFINGALLVCVFIGLLWLLFYDWCGLDYGLLLFWCLRSLLVCCLIVLGFDLVFVLLVVCFG